MTCRRRWRKWTPGSTVEDDIHYLIASALVGGRRSDAVTRATAEALLALHKKLEERGAVHQPQLAAARRRAVRRAGAARSRLADGPGGQQRVRPPGPCPVRRTSRRRHCRPAATRKLWRATVGRGEEPTSELIALAVHLPAEEARRLVERQWEHAGLRDAVVLVLAESPHPADRAKFVEALASPQSGVVAAAAEALMYLGMDATPTEIAAALRAYKQACALPAARPAPAVASAAVGVLDRGQCRRRGRPRPGEGVRGLVRDVRRVLSTREREAGRHVRRR